MHDEEEEEDEDEDEDFAWLYTLIEVFVRSLPLPGFIKRQIKKNLCDIDDGFKWCHKFT